MNQTASPRRKFRRSISENMDIPLKVHKSPFSQVHLGKFEILCVDDDPINQVFFFYKIALYFCNGHDAFSHT